ncbi:hypothetical protein [uncultured Sphingomonas sp.]|uniref:hypothetical protein n=1 Tax=uncultured Sphingomonas sp. TaxID=158754 RepID=UPI0035C94E06
MVAHRLVEALSGHDLFASARSWDGKWLSALLRSAGLPRHLLRVRDTDEALRETATEILRAVLPAARLDLEVHTIVAEASAVRTASPRIERLRMQPPNTRHGSGPGRRLAT